MIKISIKKIVTYLFILVVAFFFARYVIGNYQEIKNFEINFSFEWLIVSLILWVTSYAGFALIWREILVTLDKNVTVSKLEALHFYNLTEFSKYIPGGIWSVLSRAYYGEHLNTSRRNVLAASAIDAILTVAVILIIGGIFLALYFGGNHFYLIITAFLVGLAGMVVLHPKIFYRLANFTLKKLKREPLEVGVISYKKMLHLSFFYGSLYIVNSISFFVFVAAFIGFDWNHIFLVMAAYCLSIGLGIIVFFAPSGIGVREGMMSYFLGFVAVSPLPGLISIGSRLWMTAGEVVLLLSAGFLKKIQKLRKKESSPRA